MARSPALTDAMAEVGLSTCGKSCTYCPAGDALTGGVCRCLRDAGNVARRLARVARWLAAQVDQARAEIARLRLQVCRLTSGQAIEGDHLCPHDDMAVAALADRDAALAKLAEAKRLGLEACEVTDEAIDCPLDADAVGRIGAKAAAIRTALEDL